MDKGERNGVVACLGETTFNLKLSKERHYKRQSDFLRDFLVQGKVGRQKLVDYSGLSLQPTCARKEDALHEVWEKELEVAEGDESVKNAVTFPSLRNYNKLSDKCTRKSMEFSPAKSEGKAVTNLASTLQSNRLRSQINHLSWERVRLSKNLMILVEDKQLIESAYLQLSRKESQLAASKATRGCAILKQENSISQALKEREKAVEMCRGMGVEVAGRFGGKSAEAKKKCVYVQLKNRNYKDLIEKAAAVYDISASAHFIKQMIVDIN